MKENLEAERSVIAAIFMDQDKAFAVCHVNKVRPEWFTHPRSVIYESLEALAGFKQKITVASIFQQFQGQTAIQTEIEACVGCHGQLHTLATDVNIVAQMYGYRWLEATLQNHEATLDVAKPLDETINALLGQLQTFSIRPNQIHNTDQLLQTIEQRIEQARIKGTWGVPSRWQALNNIIAGYEERKLVIMAARPGEGKTSFMLNEALDKAKQGLPVDIYSYEMEPCELWTKMVCDEADLDFQTFKKGQASEADTEKFKATWQRVTQLPIHIYDSHLPVEALAYTIRTNHARNQTAFVCIDYVQLINCRKKSKSRQEEIGHISVTLNDVAKDTCTMLLLSQLNRLAVREKPSMSHLRDSGCLEADAYLIGLIYTDPKYHGQTTDQVPTYVEICKHRGGATGTAEFIFAKSRQKFVRKL